MIDREALDRATAIIEHWRLTDMPSYEIADRAILAFRLAMQAKGRKLVPREPTPEMAFSSSSDIEARGEFMAIWRRMYDAAGEP